jgi:uroporphyrinogen-III synthase
VAAVGAATAAALRNATGVASVLTPEIDFSAGALLELPEFAVVKGRRYLVVTGASARVDIAATLRARGADADTAAVYRRIMLEVAPSQIAAQLASADIAVVTSGEALRRLVERVPDALRDRLVHLQLVVASARMVELAKELGFITVPLVPESIAVSAFVDALAAGASQRKLQ